MGTKPRRPVLAPEPSSAPSETELPSGGASSGRPNWSCGSCAGSRSTRSLVRTRSRRTSSRAGSGSSSSREPGAEESE